MYRIIFGLFFGLHGLVHLLYIGQSARFFKLKPGMIWPDGSWAFSRLLGNEATGRLASISLLVVAVGLIAGGTGFFFIQAWWRPVVVGAAILSSLVFIFFWNGSLRNLDAQGALGILIDIAILVAVLIFRWLPTK